ncbi:pre-mRNA-splicing factor CWC25 homolog [Manduca sexta]|uniref:CBF1-interacting co-repressor CIR N-terminal domain-containing protein n=1 Tax=Manduca sexta TaxID=7130 RepID=A0A922CWE2_MANSE|nr:pre-mRNA-splicing factor CWC25 homolog [Manduca sexta]KAG6460882.1 hypothetical protein O3G_MSEX012275 [Manduca sexta]
MGGGDLNSKKSWHPNTMKNQERVWKAEQAAAEEKKRIVELQRERAEERDRTELNNMIKQNAAANMDDRLHWMYDKPDKKEQQEEYLLGKAIDKKSDYSDKLEAEAIPAVARRVVGSSMLSAVGAGDSQVDLVRKIREDPLLLIKERERAARAALLNNPLQRRKIAELLRKEQDQKKESLNLKKHKKKDKDLDSVLAAKLNALGAEKGLDLAALLDSDDSDSDSSSSSSILYKQKSKKKKKRKKQEKNVKSKKSKKKKKHSSDSEQSDNQKKSDSFEKRRPREESPHRSRDNESTSRKRHSGQDETVDNKSKTKRNRTDRTPPQSNDYDRPRRRRSRTRSREEYSRRKASPSRDKHVPKNTKRQGMSEEQRAAKLAAMVAAGAEREVDRGRRVAQQRAADEGDNKPRPQGLLRNEARSLPDSLESRIHSNRHYIQRNSRHMNEHFARR